jgi:hypothetical protein
MRSGSMRGSLIRSWIGSGVVAASALVIQAGCSAPEANSGARDETDDQGIAAAAVVSDDAQSTGAGAAATGETLDVPECVRVTEDPGVEVSLDGWAGEYVLTMVEEVEGEAWRSARGELVLHEQIAALRQFAGAAGGVIPGVGAPLFGTTDVSVAAVGALSVGDLSSDDPDAPGVLVIESDAGGGKSTMLRFGSDANRRDMTRFDGGFTVLNVHQVGDGTFSGTWSSGSRRPEANGFFCVVSGS